jgi:aerotaxis receptor
MRINLPVTDIEFEVSETMPIVSMTDLKGKITYVNPYFVEVSGFTEEELIGAPQNIIRHPDMPPSAFADMWRTIKAGLPWMGLVKNRRKDGGFYWVFAIVTPIVKDGKAVGYTSVRTKPSREQIAAAAKLYKQEKEKPGTVVLREGRRVPAGVIGRVASLVQIPLEWRLALIFSFLLLSTGALGWAASISERVTQGYLQFWPAALAVCAAVAIGGFWYFLARRIVAPLKFALETIRAMAGGDLTRKIDTELPHETGRLLRALYQLNTNLHSVMGEIRDNLQSMLSATGNIADGNNDLSARTDSQAAALEETAASMEQLTSAVKQNADNTTQGTAAVRDALTIAEKGGAMMSKVVATIAEISESSGKISDIVGIINGIASQTNLLALNAAVEAARAGDAGRGFAVVATEVRDLAQRSAAAAKEIKQLIDFSADKVEAGTVLARDAGATMREIIDAVNRVTAIIAEISSASVEQSGGISQVNDAVSQMDQMTQQNASLVQDAATATTALNHQGHRLMQALAVFKLKGRQTDVVPVPDASIAAPRSAAPSRAEARKAA